MAKTNNEKLIAVVNSYHTLYNECIDEKPDIVEKIEYELFILGSKIKNKSTLKMFKMYYQNEIDINTLIEEFSIIISSLDEQVEDLYLSKYVDMYIKYFDTIEVEIKNVQLIDELKRRVVYFSQENAVFTSQNIYLKLENEKAIQSIEDIKNDHQQEINVYDRRMTSIIQENAEDYAKNRMNNLYILLLSIVSFVLFFSLMFNKIDKEIDNFCYLNQSC